jgi:hypothetical protein
VLALVRDDAELDAVTGLTPPNWRAAPLAVDLDGAHQVRD